MNDVALRLRLRTVFDIATDLCELYGEQFDALQQGPEEVDSQQYQERRGRIHQLHTELKTLFPPCS